MKRKCPMCSQEYAAMAMVDKVTLATPNAERNCTLSALGLESGASGSDRNEVARCPGCGFVAIFHAPPATRGDRRPA